MELFHRQPEKVNCQDLNIGCFIKYRSPLFSIGNKHHTLRATSKIIEPSSPSNVAPKLLFPSQFYNLNIYKQFSLAVCFFWLHMDFLSQNMLVLPFEMWPTTVTSIGLDSLVGIIFLISSLVYHRINNLELPRILNVDKVPWRKPRQHPLVNLLAILSIFIIYYGTSYLTPIISSLLNILAIFLPLTIPMQRNLGMLISHFIWVIPSLFILSNMQQFFFNNNNNNHVNNNSNDIKIKTNKTTRYGRVEVPDFWKPKDQGGSDWLTLFVRSNWIWWVMSGYAVSVLAFRISDWINLCVPPEWFDVDNIVHQMIRPENNDVLALGVGSIAPCIFYRGLIFPWLSSFLPMSLATPLSALVFAAHHGRKEAMIPLFTLGMTWGILYLLSGNLFVTMVVHAMWNSR
eukprot:gene5991-12073_t